MPNCNQIGKLYLEVKVHTFLHPQPLGKAALLFHIIGQRVISISRLTLREEDVVVEAQVLAASHSLFEIAKLSC